MSNLLSGRISAAIFKGVIPKESNIILKTLDFKIIYMSLHYKISQINIIVIPSNINRRYIISS